MISNTCHKQIRRTVEQRGNVYFPFCGGVQTAPLSYTTGPTVGAWPAPLGAHYQRRVAGQRGLAGAVGARLSDDNRQAAAAMRFCGVKPAPLAPTITGGGGGPLPVGATPAPLAPGRWRRDRLSDDNRREQCQK
ncbi:unnamed protein product [Sphagnum balticum]